MRRIAFLSDIHGNILALEAIVRDMQQRRIDQIVTLGDLVSGPLWPAETIQFLMKQEWMHISGNHERQLLTNLPADQGLSDRYADSQLNDEEHAWLRALPSILTLDEGITLCHGVPRSDKIYLLETIQNGRTHLSSLNEIRTRLDGFHSPILACGHSHTPRIIQVPGGPLIINPGSVGMPAYTDDGAVPHVVETGSPHARYAILEGNSSGWTAQLISVSYNHQRAAQQADLNNRPELAMGLRTGYVTGE
ncbi:MAG: metallophosphoesterase family protein [Leptolinea sp.]|jgi:predicted phosphodiesterase|nr:metallophosphoesterase family protein [Leptolinea sp.]